MTPKDPFLEGTFWDKLWRPIRSRALLFTPDKRGLTNGGLNPKFSEKIGGNRPWKIGTVRGCLAPCQGLFGPFRVRSGPILTCAWLVALLLLAVFLWVGHGYFWCSGKPPFNRQKMPVTCDVNGDSGKQIYPLPCFGVVVAVWGIRYCELPLDLFGPLFWGSLASSGV